MEKSDSDSADAMEYTEHAPPRELESWIRCVWTLRAAAAAYDPSPTPIVTDGCAEIVLNLADPFRSVSRDGVSSVQPLASFIGVTLNPTVVQPTGGVDVIGIRFHPWGAAAFLGLEASRHCDIVAPLADVARRLAPLHERLLGTSRESRIALLFQELGSVARTALTVNALTVEALRIATASAPLPSVSGMASRIGCSTRSLQRAFTTGIGLGPKSLNRIARIQRALALASQHPTLGWSAIAVRAGYFDQSHLVRDFHIFVGCTPSEYSARPGALTEIFIDRA